MRAALYLTAATLVAIGIGIGVIGATGSASPAHAVLTAAERTIATGSADITATLTSSGLPGGTTLTGTGTGETDLQTGDADLTFHYASSRGNYDLGELIVGGKFYLSVAGIDQILPGRQWIEVPITVATSETGGLEANPASALQGLAAEGDSVGYVGSSTVGGESDQEYSVTIPAANLRQQVLKEDLPASLQRSALKLIDKGLVPSYDVWIGPDNDLHQVSVNEDLSAAGVPGASVTVVTDFTDLGTNVAISAPPASEVATYQEFVAAAKNAGLSLP